MAAVWYIGQATRRTVGVKDWEVHGIMGRLAVTWEPENAWSVPHSTFTTAQLAVLNNDPLFVVGSPDGPRQGVPTGIDSSDPATKGWVLEQVLQNLGVGTFATINGGSVVAGGAASLGVPQGGAAGHVLTKVTSGDFDTQWKPAAAASVIEGPRGPEGPAGPAGTSASIAVAGTTTLAAGSAATVTQGGSATARTLTFGIPRGADGAAGAAGTNGTNGTNGTTPTIAIGTVTTLAAGSAATVTAGGTATARTFSFGIPRGADGAAGSGGTTVNSKNAPFIVRYIGSAWEYTTLAAAKTAGLIDAQTVWFVGGTTPPSWARSGDIYTQF